jgi:hypothetical protein
LLHLFHYQALRRVLLGLRLRIGLQILVVLLGFLLSTREIDELQRDLFPFAALAAQVTDAVLDDLVFAGQVPSLR